MRSFLIQASVVLCGLIVFPTMNQASVANQANAAGEYRLAKSYGGAILCYGKSGGRPVEMDFCRCSYKTEFKMVKAWCGGGSNPTCYECGEVGYSATDGSMFRLAYFGVGDKQNAVYSPEFCELKVVPKNPDLCQKLGL